MLLRHVLAISLSIISASAFADSLDISLSNDVAQFQYIAPMGHVGQGKSEAHMGFLYNNSNNVLGDVGLLVMNNGDNAAAASFGVGVKVIAATLEKENTMALALGGQVRLSPSDDKKLGIVGQLYFAPDIVTFGDADRFIETGVRVEYEVMQQAAAYVGYRKIKFNVNTLPAPFPAVGKVLDEGIHVGVRVAF